MFDQVKTFGDMVNKTLSGSQPVDNLDARRTYMALIHIDPSFNPSSLAMRMVGPDADLSLADFLALESHHRTVDEARKNGDSWTQNFLTQAKQYEGWLEEQYGTDGPMGRFLKPQERVAMTQALQAFWLDVYAQTKEDADMFHQPIATTRQWMFDRIQSLSETIFAGAAPQWPERDPIPLMDELGWLSVLDPESPSFTRLQDHELSYISDMLYGRNTPTPLPDVIIMELKTRLGVSSWAEAVDKYTIQPEGNE
jgi:hypothetical protein